jgi:multiple sugar transport system substrate-binding protein
MSLRETTAILTATAIILFLLLAGCRKDPVDTPRIATIAAASEATPTTAPTPFLLEAPTSGNGIEPVVGDQAGDDTVQEVNSLTVWINTTTPENRAVIDEIISDFGTKNSIHVDVLHVSPDALPELVQAALESGSLPDILFHPIEFSHGWLAQGILNSDATTEILDALGSDTFDASALDLLRVGSEAREVAALPVDLNRQLIVFRKDWFSEQNLEVPDNFDSMLTAVQEIYDPENNIYGLVLPTDSTLVTTQRVFEHLALSNGCDLVSPDGEVTFLHPTCLEALEYYRSLVNEFSPIGVQTEISALNAYLAGRTALIVAPSSALPIIAGMEQDMMPSCSECEETGFLAENSGILFAIQGSSDLAMATGAAEINALGITNEADIDAAAAFTLHWFIDGYGKWLSVNPESKVPLRYGLPDQPTLFQDLWLEMPLKQNQQSLTDIYGSEVTNQLVGGAHDINRWGLEQHQGQLITDIYEEPLLSPLLQEMLSGYITSSQTVIEIFQAVVAEIPEYDFTIPIIPSPVPAP